jgi:tetratricopeptide (TPR) repeat protein
MGGLEENAIYWFETGVSFVERREWDRGIACFYKAIEINHEFTEAWINKAVCLEATGKHKEAVMCLDMAITLAPRNAEAWHGKGVALESLNRHDEALFCFNKALESEPSHVKALSNKGVSLKRLGKLYEALGCFEKAIDKNHDFVLALYNKAATLQELGNHKEAIEVFGYIITNHPNTPQAVQAAKQIKFSETIVELESLSDVELAEEGLSRDFVTKFKESMRWYLRGLDLEQGGMYQEAIESFNKSIELSPPGSDEHINLVKSIVSELKLKARMQHESTS